MPYPVSLNLNERLCIIIGGGSVAARRAKKLRANGAKVRVIAPETVKELDELVSAGEIEFLAEKYNPDHLKGAFLVITATDDTAVNEAVGADAKFQGILVCRADSNLDGDFSILASVDRGDMTLAVSTSGTSPTLSAIVKRRLESDFGPEWDTWTALFGRLRVKFQSVPTEGERLAIAEEILNNEEVKTQVMKANLGTAEREALRCF